MTAVVWEPSPGVRLAADPVHLRLAGAGVAIAIGGAEAAAASLVVHVDALWAGVLSVALLGAWLGPLVVQRPVSAMVRMAVLPVVIGSVIIGGWMAATTPSVSDPALALVAWPLIGLLIFGLPALALTLPSAFAWMHGVRWLANHRGSPA